MSVVLLVAVVLPGLAALACAAGPGAPTGHAGRIGASAAAIAFCAAFLVGIDVVTRGPVELVTVTEAGRATFGLFADRVGVVMLLLVLGVSAVVQLFTSRYLSGDPRESRLIAAAGLTTSAVATVVCAATASVLLVAWLASGAGVLAMLAQRADLPAARTGLRRAAGAFAVGDLALVLAFLIAWSTIGDLDLRTVPDEAQALADERATVAGVTVDAAAVVACLLVFAALGRSAQLPLQRWLPATLAAPTPVSAFLHAGLVNAGGFLLVRLGPIFSSTPVATYLAFAAGAATALYGTALMLAKPDVKGALAHSTMGQMGFMVLACALGAFSAAIFHLVAHGMYKATLFLGADSVIHRGKQRASVPRPAPAGTGWSAPMRFAVAAAVPAVALTLALTTFAADALAHPGAIVLIAFAWASAASAGQAWLGATPGRAAGGLTLLAGCCLLYAGAVAGADAFLGDAVSEAAHAATPWAGLVLAAAVGAAAVLRLGLAPVLRERLYVRALDAGHVARTRATPSGPTRLATPRPRSVPA